MRTRSTTIIAAGVIIALLGALAVFTYARSVDSRSAAAVEMVEAYTAVTDIPAGTRGEDLAAYVQRTQVPVTATPATAVAGTEELAGRIAVRHVGAGEVVTAAQFGAATASGVAPAAGLQIPPGHNAVAMNLPIPHGVARYVQPGDHVNVYATFKGGDGITKLVLSNILVLSNAPATATAGTTATGGEVLLTMALLPHDAERLIYAREHGSLWLGLVHAGDGPVAGSGANQSTVIG